MAPLKRCFLLRRPRVIEASTARPFTAVCYSLTGVWGGEFHASNAIFKPLNIQDTLSNVCPDIAFYSAAGGM
ncbi:deoxyribose operon repressor domain protein [Enterobacter hormaechei subsp. xiangfangensis]|nr:deoxyribose operon repressor domain protein [Enterobacter hormaechei subsp. xiangfangensis]